MNLFLLLCPHCAYYDDGEGSYNPMGNFNDSKHFGGQFILSLVWYFGVIIGINQYVGVL